MAHALHAVISSGKWKNDSTNGTHISQNGDAILEHLKKVGFEGARFEHSPGMRILSKKRSFHLLLPKNVFDFFQVVITGTTDLIQFNDSGSRINSKLDVRNLRDDKFVTVSISLQTTFL